MIKDFILRNFNNREVVLFIYLVVFIIWTFSNKQIRKSIFNLLETLSDKRILLSILAILIYVSIIIYGLYSIKIWDITLLKDTIYWTFGVGFIMMMNTNKVIQEDNYFKNLLKDNFKLLLVMEFILGLYVFGFFIELLLAPIVIFFSILLVMSETSTKYYQVKNFLQIVFGIAGIAYLFFSLYKIYQDFTEFASFGTLKSFLFPILMTIIFLPFIYLYTLFTQYESLFVRLGFSLKDNNALLQYAKKRILSEANISITKIRKISPGFLFHECRTKNDIDMEIKRKLSIN
jgi:hypothetical protein